MNYDPNCINVVYCSSDLFSEVCAVSIVSLFENNKHLEKITAYVIDDQISQQNKARFEEIARKYGRTINMLPMPDPSAFYHDSRFTFGSLGRTFARLILGDVLPADVQRVISLDADTMVLGKIDDLWNTDMGAHPIAGVDDCMGRVALVKTQHMKADSIHCNAGMYLINLKAWRDEHWTEAFFEYIKGLFDKGIRLGGYEEEVITKVVGDRMLVLHPRFNLMTLEQVFDYKELLRFRCPLCYYSEQEIKEAKTNPVITHTTNFFYIRKRIFQECSDHPMRAEYEKYRALSPWADDPAMTVNKSWKQLVMKNIWHCMPKTMAIDLGKFVRNEVRPLLAKKRDDE